MHKIQDLFDASKRLNRSIESVVTFGANTEQDLSAEIQEYVVTDKLHQNYENVIQDLQTAFDDSSKEVGIWVSGFYGSGKSSFAKYLGLSFDKSIMIDGVSFGDKLMSRIHDTAITAMHKTILTRHNPQVVMIDLSTQSIAGKIANVSDIVYYETLKLLGITKSTDQKVMCFIDLLHSEGKYEEFCKLVETEKNKTWESIESNDLAANLIAANLAPRILPEYFPNSASFKEINLNSALNEKERFTRLYKLVKEKTGKDKIIFVLDEIGQYVASNVDLILNVQGMMQIFKDEFKGNVWVIATAQQTLTEDNRQAQLNSNELFRLNDRFPIKVDIEANDIKEIITKRLLGKSKEGQQHLKTLFNTNEGSLKKYIHLTLQERSLYNQVLTAESFADLYPFLPVHIDILLSLLQKLASRTGGVGLRSVIRLIRDILVDNHLADATIGQMAGPEHFYDVLHADMERNSAKEIVIAADKAIQTFNGNNLAVRICKTIAIMQLLDDFNLSFDNICALIYNTIGTNVDKTRIRQTLQDIMDTSGLTLQEVNGKYQFMTNAILGICEERNKFIPSSIDKAKVLQEQLQDIFTPAPSVNVFQSKTITAGIELSEQNRPYIIHATTNLKINIRFVEGAIFDETHQFLLTESTRSENNRTLFWLCTLSKDKEPILQEIVRSQRIKTLHQNEKNKEIEIYLQAQTDNANERKHQLSQLLREAMNNSEMIFRGNPQQVNTETYRTIALKSIAEKIFEKYPLAPTNMKADCVTKLASYGDITTIPDALNPFKIINKSTGLIDVSHLAILAIKDFIASRNEVTGQELMNHFERDPYGWAKDTIRYIVALTLKANVIQIRVAGKNITVFGDSAVEAMTTNNSFNKISISLITEGVLTNKDRLNAVQNLVSLFNCGRVAPINDAIAKVARTEVPKYVSEFNNLLPIYENLNLAGLDKIRSAINYAQKIIGSEGGDAVYLLGKEVDCVNAIKYAMEIMKCNKTSSLFDHIRHINHIITDSETLPELTQLSEFRKRINEVAQLYNEYTQNPDLNSIVSDITDLSNQVNSYIKQGCIDFQTESNSLLNDNRERIISSLEYSQLTEEKKSEVKISLNKLNIDCGSYSIESLRLMVNSYVSFNMNNIAAIEKNIKAYASINKPAISITTTGGKEDSAANQQSAPQDVTEFQGKEVNEPEYTPKHVSLKRKISTRQELQEIINALSKLLSTVGDNSPIELNLND